MSDVREKMNICSRWESSRKSLFVKTIWVEGHRHVILFDEDPLAGYFKLAKTPSRVASSISKSSSRSVTKSAKSAVCENFRVPSVKLLLAGMRNFKKGPVSSRRSSYTTPAPSVRETLSIEVIPNDNVKFKNINGDVLIIPSENLDQRNNGVNLLKAFQISRIPSLDTDCREEYINGGECSDDNYVAGNLLTSHFPNMDANFGDRCNNSLSDRVLTWLDLATQHNEDAQNSEDVRDKIRSFCPALSTLKNRVVTAHFCGNFRKQPSIDYTKTLQRSRSYDCQDKAYADESSKKEATILKTTEIPRYSTLKINDFENSPLVYEKKRLSSSIPEINSYPENPISMADIPTSNVTTKHRTEILKRQIHIFMPNIPKKSEDCDSSLSTKSSSLMKRSSL